MGRELKRVPLDFDWPLNKIWDGFKNPHYTAKKCVYCDGTGYGRQAKFISDQWYGYVQFDPSMTGSVKLTPETDIIRLIAENNVTRSPEFYGKGERAIRNEAIRLSDMWNKQWCHHLDQHDVNALWAKGRLADLNQNWRENHNEGVTPPTASEVNRWSLTGFGHDAINHSYCVEAKMRTTSVYLVDRVIPMLPEVLSNELCSIRQDEDKLAYSCIFKIEKETGKVLETWYGRTIIKSNKRFSYEEAQEIITKGDGLFYPELSELMRLSKIYTQDRFRDGALSMDTDEVRFILDETGKPIRVMIKKRIDTMRMIEEWMLMANKYVAIKLSDKNSAGLAVYRVHDKPSPDRVEDLITFLKSVGFKNIPVKNGIIPPHDLQKILDSAATDDARDTIQSSIVRSMAKAIYSTTNIGHFGLAFSFYTHFTSPIRRYPDVMVHRLMQLTLEGRKVDPADAAEYVRMCAYSSDREKDAADAERESIKYKQVEYMTERVGQTFNGIVTGLGKFGVFVAEAESKSEGMIRLMDLGSDFFAYDEKRNVIAGRSSKQEFHFGQKIKIKVKSVNLERRMIDYVLVQESSKEKAA
jgi:ribonuclease R